MMTHCSAGESYPYFPNHAWASVIEKRNKLEQEISLDTIVKGLIGGLELKNKSIRDSETETEDQYLYSVDGLR